jgi:hypothetical protein
MTAAADKIEKVGIMTSAISRSHALATSTYLESVRGHPPNAVAENKDTL